MIFDASGDIVTNAHVIAGASSMRVTLADGRRFPARLVGAYPPDDLAVVSIGAGHNVKPARFGDSSKVEVGDIVLAAGNPLGLQSSVTDGIVSAIGRTVSEGQGVVLPNAIQTSAPINPGNSGGALVDLAGQVIGIPTLAAGNPQTGGTAAGIGFAIPSNIVRDIAGQIVRNGRVINSHRAALGVNLADNLARPGAVITALQPGGPAEKAGLSRRGLDRIHRWQGSGDSGRPRDRAGDAAPWPGGHRRGRPTRRQTRDDDRHSRRAARKLTRGTGPPAAIGSWWQRDDRDPPMRVGGPRPSVRSWNQAPMHARSAIASASACATAW